VVVERGYVVYWVIKPCAGGDDGFVQAYAGMRMRVSRECRWYYKRVTWVSSIANIECIVE
jgi:hypothetical protein